MSKYGHRPHNWFEAIVNKMGGEKEADRFLRGEAILSYPLRTWREEDGVIRFSVTSDGATGEEWEFRIKSRGFRMSPYVTQALRSPFFVPTIGVTAGVAILKGALFGDDNPTTEKILVEACRRNLSAPSMELACLIREKFRDEEIEAMGLHYIVVMHEPINEFGGGSGLLGAGPIGRGGLFSMCKEPFDGWAHGNGFAFVVSQTQV